MTGYSKLSDDKLVSDLRNILCSPTFDSTPFLSDSEFCMDALIKEKLEFIPLEHGFEVRGFDKSGNYHIAKNKNANRAICECYLMIKEGK